MNEDRRAEKRAKIADAAYALIEEKGYGGMSMLAVAKAAKASNETLYNWYGDKAGLFRALVEENAGKVIATLEQTQAAHDDPLAALRAVSQSLLTTLLGERAIALNRAAAADPTGDLGAALAKEGRGRIAPLIGGLIARTIAAGYFDGEAKGVAETYIALLLGDLQIRRVTHALEAPDAGFCAARTDEALAHLARLFPAQA